jgi:methionyl-tRNA synthetase
MINPNKAKARKILVTSALPYANGPLHLGHIVEHIQSDIWVRFQKMQGNTCYFVCGSDAHGTPIMLQAEKNGIAPEELVASYHQEHKQDLQDFGIEYDNFYTTHSQENKEFSTYIYQKLQKNGDIFDKTIEQAFDPVKNIFLPDRYVKGNCPKCNATDQYGDNCEVCGAHYSPLELKNPISAISGVPPIRKSSEHYFFSLSKYQQVLLDWIKQDSLQPEIANKLKEWFITGLKDWDISRDAPYFGFEIPDTKNKYFYVWLDAPIGYMASFKNFCEKQDNLNFTDYWNHNNTELYHFIGKDIVYFHALFWPAVLTGSNFRLPTKICVHGFLLINGEKMSKSRGTFITVKKYLNTLPPEALRYYFAAKLSDGIDDLDLNFENFVNRVNADLVGKFINIGSRCAKLLTKHFSGKLIECSVAPELSKNFILAGDIISKYYENRQYAKAMRKIMDLADEANKFIAEQKPWLLIKEKKHEVLVQEICSLGLNLFRVLMTYLKPVLPGIAKQVEAFLNISELKWSDINIPLIGHQINNFAPLLQRLELSKVNNIMQDNNNIKDLSKQTELEKEPIFSPISIEDFTKVDLRIARIIAVENIPEANKLLKLTLDLGGATKQVFAGIKEAYTPEMLVNKLTVVVANLAPRKMRFGTSEGMVLAAGPGGKNLWILEPHIGAQPGMRVK